MNQIFHICEDGQLIEMIETPFKRETDFQELLKTYPNLLSINQLDNDQPCRWLEIDREIRLSAQEDVPGRMAVDHLYLDQRAIPTLVEVKRKEDTRIRREVVGQMLDYAACAAITCQNGDLQDRFEHRCEEESADSDEVLDKFLEGSQEPDEFWQQAEINLQCGRIRLVFVADQIPITLQRIIEFLNKQMDPAEVLGVELKHYSAGNLSSLVPLVIGQTVEAVGRKRPRRVSDETLETWMSTAEAKGVGTLFREVVEALHQVFPDRSSADYGVTFREISPDSGRLATLIRINPRGASPEKGIRYIAHIDRLIEHCQVDENPLREHLPNFEKFRKGRRYVGYFQNIDEVKQLANFIKTSQTK